MTKSLDERVTEFLTANTSGKQTFRTTIDLNEENFKKFRIFCKYRGIKVADLLDVYLEYINETHAEEITRFLLEGEAK